MIANMFCKALVKTVTAPQIGGRMMQARCSQEIATFTEPAAGVRILCIKQHLNVKLFLMFI
jgi:hypothetical protein